MQQSVRDRAIVEARARGVDVKAAVRRPFRQMVKPGPRAARRDAEAHRKAAEAELRQLAGQTAGSA